MGNIFEPYEVPQRYTPNEGEFIDDFQIIKELGAGSFGVVYKVKAKNGELLALKLIKLWEFESEKYRKEIIERFIREFTVSRLDCSFLVHSYTYGKKKGNPYFTMEFCKGGSLENHCGRFAEHFAKDKISYDILRGLKRIHQEGFSHRDIKPANILIDVNERVAQLTTKDIAGKLGDFGLAGHNTSKLSTVNFFGKPDRIFGTWAYLAPEQENNRLGKTFKALNKLSDIFSFGVTMFELFTGEYPFPPYQLTTDKELVAYRINVKNGNFDNLQKMQHLIPEKWVKVIEKCLQVDCANKRWQSVDEIIAALGYVSIDIDLNKKPANPDFFALKITYGEELNKTYSLADIAKAEKSNILTIGRKDVDVSNQIEIVEKQSLYISRRHATIEKWENPTRWRIRDGQFTKEGWKPSLNGLFVNAKFVGANGVVLHEGDIISLGDTNIKVESL